VDTQKSIETRMSIGFPAFAPQFNRTLLTGYPNTGRCERR